MRYLCLFTVLFLLMAGCQQIMPPPSIEVQRNDTPDYTGATVYFKHFHGGNDSSIRHITLRSPEEIAEFRKKLEFVVARLEEAENRMNVHEPKTPPKK